MTETEIQSEVAKIAHDIGPLAECSVLFSNKLGVFGCLTPFGASHGLSIRVHANSAQEAIAEMRKQWSQKREALTQAAKAMG